MRASLLGLVVAVELLALPDIAVRRAAVLLWRHCHPGQCLDEGERAALLADPDVGVRARLADISAEQRDEGTLRGLALDEHVWVRHLACRALAALGEDR